MRNRNKLDRKPHAQVPSRPWFAALGAGRTLLDTSYGRLWIPPIVSDCWDDIIFEWEDLDRC